MITRQMWFTGVENNDHISDDCMKGNFWNLVEKKKKRQITVFDFGHIHAKALMSCPFPVPDATVSVGVCA